MHFPRASCPFSGFKTADPGGDLEEARFLGVINHARAHFYPLLFDFGAGQGEGSPHGSWARPKTASGVGLYEPPPSGYVLLPLRGKHLRLGVGLDFHPFRLLSIH